MNDSPQPSPATLDVAAAQRRRIKRITWETRWKRPDYDPPWLDRGISPEIVEAVESGWFPPGTPALDIGCGQGEVAAWLAAQGFPATGMDIASAAIARAQRMHAGAPGDLEFLAADICGTMPQDTRQFGILIDRGCFHQIERDDHPAYAANLARISSPSARLLLFMRTFRHGVASGDPVEEQRVMEIVHRALGATFTIERHLVTHLDSGDGTGGERALPGIVFWLTRRA